MRLFSYSGGIPVPYEQEVQYPKKEGYSLSLTIDSALQEIVVEKGRKGFERMQPRKMSILAMDQIPEKCWHGPIFPVDWPIHGRTVPNRKSPIGTDDRRRTG